MILALDTSSQQTSVAVARQNNIKSNNSSSDSHSSSLSQTVFELLNTNQISIKDLDTIVLGSGPGSFTGLRIGYSFAKGLALALTIPIVEVSSLMASAWEFRAKAKHIIVLEDARRSEFFVACYSWRNQNLETELQECILNFDEIQQLNSKFPEALMVSSNQSLKQKMSDLASPKNLAESLLRIYNHMILPLKSVQKGTIEQLSNRSPSYIRAVSAKTIKDRLSS